jgi:hypothetical protein
MSEAYFEEVANQLSEVTEEGLSRVSSLALQQIEKQKHIENLEGQLKMAKKDLAEIQENELPAAIAEYNLKEFTLGDGTQISVKRFYNVSIPKDEEKRQRCFDWLNENGFGDLIKNNVSVNFPKGKEQEAFNFIQELDGRNLAPSNKKWVEPMTLKAFAKDQIERGNPFPSDTFGLFIGERATIKKK